MINYTLLGSGGNVPTPQRHLSASIFEYNGRLVLIDCGEGTQVAMKKFKTGFKNLDLICLTHLHSDHTIGLIGLLSTVANAGRTEPITIVGPSGTIDTVRAMMIINDGVPYRVNVIENPDGPFSVIGEGIKDLSISTLRVEHSKECLAYSLYFKRARRFSPEMAEKNDVPKRFWNMLQGGRSFYFDDRLFTPDLVLGEERRGIKISLVTDSRPTEAIPGFIHDSDLFICEGMYGDDMDISKAVKNMHMIFRESAGLAKKGGVKKLVLTHFSPSMERPSDFLSNATDIFADTVLGYDGLKLEIKYRG